MHFNNDLVHFSLDNGIGLEYWRCPIQFDHNGGSFQTIHLQMDVQQVSSLSSISLVKFMDVFKKIHHLSPIISNPQKKTSENDRFKKKLRIEIYISLASY